MASIVCVSVFAESDVDARLKAMEDRLNKIEQENSDLKAAVKNVQKDELGARVDDLEKSVFSNRITWGVGMKNMDDYFSGEYSNGTKYFNPNVMSTKLMLNMEAKVTDDMKFTGRLSMYKYWANNLNTSAGDPMDGRRPGDSRMFAERAYVDWNAIKGSVPVTFTIGRQPSSDGPSHEYGDNTVRKSTYSALAFDGAADGIVTTFDFEKLTGISNAAVRVAYGKGYQNDACTGLGCSATGMGYNGVADTTIYGLFIDGSIPYVDNSLVQVGVVRAIDVYNPQGAYRDNATGAMTHITPANLAVASQALGGASVYGVQSGGNVTIMGMMAEATNIKDSGLDAFAHYGVSKSTPRAGVTGMYGSQIDGSGDAYWAGARYDISRLISGAGKFGYEYNHGSKNWVNFTQGSDDITNKLATRGSVHDVYYLQPINRYAFFKIGYENIKYDYTGSGMFWGTPVATNSAQAQGMGAFALKNLQDIYAQFNLQY